MACKKAARRYLRAIGITCTAMTLGWSLPAAGGALDRCTVSDLGTYPIVDIPKPEYLETYKDPSFGFEITRVTGEPGEATGCGKDWLKESIHHYSSMPVWNADGSILLIKRPPTFLNANTYEPVCLNRPPSGNTNWHPTNPDLMIYLKGRDLLLWNVMTGQSTKLGSFAGYNSLTMGRNNRSLLSNDGRYITLQAVKDNKKVAFVYDIIDKKKYPDILTPKNYDQAQGSPLGNYVIFTFGGLMRSIFTRDGQMIDVYDALKHVDTAVDGGGNEVVAGIRNRRPLRPDDPPSGSVVKLKLSNVQPTTLLDVGSGNHLSARNILAEGWFVVSYDNAKSPFDHEIVAVADDGSGRIVRLAHHYSKRYSYRNEPHASISPDGSKVIFASNWGVRGPTSAYVIDIACSPAAD